STAQKIIDARPYTKIEDLLNVSGIGENTYAKFKELICV
ncbi:helix-hairpin-helix domain-containing protein, partial [bacterium]|nr:helix-hairpin-helix domain-containing protein [bacterium]